MPTEISEQEGMSCPSKKFIVAGITVPAIAATALVGTNEAAFAAPADAAVVRTQAGATTDAVSPQFWAAIGQAAANAAAAAVAGAVVGAGVAAALAPKSSSSSSGGPANGTTGATSGDAAFDVAG